jgi:hypothetical protein|tara:strand:+ start:962 stop:1153 length:192 start_codon:yes stop_codon:yes gene_type:complete
METYQALKPKSYWLMVDKIKAHNKLQELKRIDKKRRIKRNISEFLFVVGLFGSAYLLLILGNI